mgnify:CR=1 FL=1
MTEIPALSVKWNTRDMFQIKSSLKIDVLRKKGDNLQKRLQRRSFFRLAKNKKKIA